MSTFQVRDNLLLLLICFFAISFEVYQTFSDYLLVRDSQREKDLQGSNFLLVKRNARSQPMFVMKNLHGTFKLIVLAAAVGILAVLSFQACVITSPAGFKRQFGLEITKTFQLFDVEGFIKALNTLSKSAIYEFHIVRDNGKSEDFRSGSMRSIKTDKVTMFKIPKSTSAEEFTVIGSQVTQRLYSNNVNDIQKILDQLKKQEP